MSRRVSRCSQLRDAASSRCGGSENTFRHWACWELIRFSNRQESHLYLLICSGVLVLLVKTGTEKQLHGLQDEGCGNESSHHSWEGTASRKCLHGSDQGKSSCGQYMLSPETITTATHRQILVQQLGRQGRPPPTQEGKGSHRHQERRQGQPSTPKEARQPPPPTTASTYGGTGRNY